MLSIGTFDNGLTIAMCSFAAAIPLLVKDILDVEMEERRGISVNAEDRFNTMQLGIMAALAGIAAIFWHFSWLFCALFLVVTYWALWDHVMYMGDLKEHAKSKD